MSTRPRRFGSALLTLTLLAAITTATPAGAAEPTTGWTSSVGSNGDVRYFAAAEGPDGSVILAGWDRNGNETDGVVRKLDAAGSQQWKTEIGVDGAADYIDAVDVAPDGNIFVTGRTRGDIAGRIGGTDFDMFVAKLSPSGSVLWTQQFGQNGTNFDEAGLTVAAATDGSVFVGTYVGDSTGPAIVRYNSAGVEQWAFTYGQAGDFPADMAMGSDGSAYISGEGSGGEGFLISASLGGTMSSSTRMPGSGPIRVSASSDGDIVAGGGTYLARFGIFGLEEWEVTTAVDITDVAVESDDSIVAIVDGSAILRGFTSTGTLESWSKALSGQATGYVVATTDGGVVTTTPGSNFDTMHLARFNDSSSDGTVAGFTDVAPGLFYSDGVAWLKAEGITTGTSSTTYSPNDLVTRAQMAAFLHRMVGSPGGNPAHGFSDVADTTFYAEAVRWLKDQGITTGTSSTTYSPGDNVTRAQMAAFLHRLAGSPGNNPAHGFSDVADTTFYAEAVRWLKDQGITTGTSSTTYSPGDNVTRAQMAAFLYRMATDSDWDYPGD